MSEPVDNQRGGAYEYQWTIATLIACEAFRARESDPKAGLPVFVYKFLETVSNLHLEAPRDADGKEIAEDINLHHGDRSVFVQVKARAPDQPSFKKSEIAEFMTNFCRTAQANGNTENHLYVVVSDGSMADVLSPLKADPSSRCPEAEFVEGMLKGLKDAFEPSPEQKKKGAASKYDESLARNVLNRTVLLSGPTSGEAFHAIRSILLAGAPATTTAEQLIQRFGRVSRLKDPSLRKVTAACFAQWLTEGERLSQLWPKLESQPDILQDVENLVGDLGTHTLKLYGLCLKSYLTQINSCATGLDRLTSREVVALVVAAAIPHWQDGESASDAPLSFLAPYPALSLLMKTSGPELLTLSRARDVHQPLPSAKESGSLRLRWLASLIRLGTLLEYAEEGAPTTRSESAAEDVLEFWQRRYLRGIVGKPGENQIRIEFVLPEKYSVDYDRWLVKPFVERLTKLLTPVRDTLADYGVYLHPFHTSVLPSPDVESIETKDLALIYKDYALRRGLELYQENIDQKLVLAQATRDELQLLLDSLQAGKAVPYDEQALELLTKLREMSSYAQARRLSERLIEVATSRGELRVAAKFRVSAVRAIFDGGFPPELANEHLDALDSAKFLDDEDTITALLLRARHHLGCNFDLKAAEQCYEQAFELAKKAEAFDALAEVTNRWAFLYVLDHNWLEAHRILMLGYSAVADHLLPALAILTSRMNLATMSGNWEFEQAGLDHVHLCVKFRAAYDGEESRRFRLARTNAMGQSGDIKSALSSYIALEREVGDDDPSFLRLLLSNSQYFIISTGYISPDHQRREDLRIDLFHSFALDTAITRRLHTAHQQHSSNQPRSSLQCAFLAMEDSWLAGEWVDVENIWKLLTRLYRDDGQHYQAVMAAIHHQEHKLLEQVIDNAIGGLTVEESTRLLEVALTPSNLARVEQHKLRLLSALSDLIPPSRISEAIERVRHALKTVIKRPMDRWVFGEAGKALTALVRDAEFSTQEVLLELLEETFHHSHEEAREQAVHGIRIVANSRCWKLDEVDRRRIAEGLLKLIDANRGPSNARGLAYETVSGLLKNSAEVDRAWLAQELEQRRLLRVKPRAELSRPLTEDEAEAAVSNVLERLAPAPQFTKGGGQKVSFYAVSAGEILHYFPYLRDHQVVLMRLLKTFASEHCQFSSRVSIAAFLKWLPSELFSTFACQIETQFLEFYHQGLASTWVAKYEVDTRRSIFSGFRVNSTTEARVREGILWVLGRALAYVSNTAIETTLAVAALSQEREIRRGASMGLLCAAQDGFSFSPSLRGILLVLVGNEDTEVQVYSVSAIGWALSQKLIADEGSFTVALLGRSHSQEPRVRNAAAWAIKRVLQNQPDIDNGDMLKQRLAGLANDRCRQVRTAAAAIDYYASEDFPKISKESL